MSIDINQLYDAGIKQMAEEHDAKEVGKLGILRAGNTGIVLSGGKVAGPCARQTLLRLEGMRYENIEDNKRLMFDAGLSNEDIWVKSLEAGIAATGKALVIRREEEIPIKWETPSGLTVTGRPDIVVGRMDGEEFKPLLGLELKLASSVWTARDTGVMLEPKLIHLMQSAHYSWKLDVPFQLWYTNRAEFAVGSGWEQRTFPNQKDLLTDVLEFGQSKGKVTVKKILQFRQGYELEWTGNGQLKYRPLLSGNSLAWTFTPITKEGIVNYYETVVAQRTEKKLAPRPLVLKADGSPGTYNACDYCPLKYLCDSSEKNYERWMSEVQVHVSNLK
jgi:hypothetical protein